MTPYQKISDALSICMPETFEEGETDCIECPFYESCKNEEESIAFPRSLALEIREYFSKNKRGTNLIQ